MPTLASGMSLEERKNIEQMVLESKSSWDNSQQKSSYSESDILNELGVEAHAKDGNEFEGDDVFNQSLSDSSTSGFVLRRQGNEELLCEYGAVAQLANLEVKVLECKDGQYQVAMCDATSFGHNCSEHNTHTDFLDISGSKQIFRHGVFNGTYQLESTCSIAACDIRYKAVYQQDFSTVSIGSKNQGDEAASNHSVNGSVFNNVSAIYDPVDPKLVKVRKDVQDNKNKHIECYTERMNELNSDGKVRQSCDPSDVRTFSFITEKNQGASFGKMMCERTEEGYCNQDIAIHERLDFEGEQICTFQYGLSDESCASGFELIGLHGSDVIHIERNAGNNARAIVTKSSCGDGCTEFLIDNYWKYGNNNLNLNMSTAEEYIDFNYYNKSAIKKVILEAPRYDGFLRVWSGDEVVLDTHPEHYGVANNYSNRVLGETDITELFKQGMNNSSNRLRLSLWVTRDEGEYVYKVRIWHKNVGAKIMPYNNCVNYDNKNPSENEVAGCYVNSIDTCTDTAPRTLNDDYFNPGCWEYKKNYTCFDNLSNNCDVSLLQNNGWVKQREFGKEYPFSSIGQNTSNPWKWDEEWTYKNSNGLDASFGCAPPHTTSTQDMLGGTINVTKSWCYKEQPQECHPSPPETEEEATICRVNSTDCITEDKGLCVQQRQNFVCETAYVCEVEDSNSEYQAPDNTAALAKVIAEGERAKALSGAFAGNMSEDADGNITIFNGKLNQCNKYSSKFFDYMDWPVNLPFYTIYETLLGGLDRDTRNCCIGLPEDINTTANAANCTQEDIKLAAKRLASAAHLIELDGITPVASGNTTYGEDFQDASVAYGKKCYPIGVDRVCTLRDDDEFQTCLSYAIDVSINVPDYISNERWAHDSDLPRKAANLNQLAIDNHYFVEEKKYGIPSKICQNVLFDPSCGSDGCDRVIKKEIKADGQTKDYYDSEKCACESIAADGSCAKMPDICRVYPNEEDIDLVGVDDVVTDGHWLPGRFEACAFWSRYNVPFLGLFMRPGSAGHNSSEELHKLALKPNICKEYVWDFVDRVPIDHYQSWCTFDDPFARIIQEQGRKQLALYATRPETGSITDIAEFSFYTPVIGGWTQAKIVNKQDVRFWQWPHNCTDTATATKANITDQSCPQNADVYIAVCSSEGACGALPENPVLQSSGKWDIRLLRGEDPELHALTPLLVVQGNCTSNGLCKYNLHAWQKAVSGSMDVPIDMNWALKGVNGGWKINYNNHNQIHLMAYTEPLVLDAKDIFDFEIGQSKPTEKMPSPKLKMCLGSPSACKIDAANDDTLWKIINLDSPTSIDGQVINDPRLTGGIRVKAFGQCSTETLNCAYRIVANIKLEAKPWHKGVTYDTFKAGIKPKVFGKYIGGKKTQHYNHQLKADCSGFTLDQFLALNLTAMDLREYTDRIAQDAEQKVQQMANDNTLNVQADADKITRGESTTMTGTGTKNFRLFPDNGYPGEETQLQPMYVDEENRIALTKNGITITHKVLSYTVDWEGRPHTIMTYSPSQSPTYKYGDLELQSIGETIIGSIIWHTDTGDISESFTYKIWFNPNESGGGGKIGAGTVSGTTSAKESLDSPIKQFNELDEDLRKLDPQNW